MYCIRDDVETIKLPLLFYLFNGNKKTISGAPKRFLSFKRKVAGIYKIMKRTTYIIINIYYESTQRKKTLFKIVAKTIQTSLIP